MMVIGRWGTVDPLAEKYYALTPYGYVANNPIKLVDVDGRDIIAVNAIKRDGHGDYVYENGRVSAKTANAINALMSTKEGVAFFAQFARKGQRVFGHTFNENGKYSNHDLVIQDFSLQKETSELNIPIAAEGAFIPKAKGDKATFYLQLSSFSQDESALVETATHETQLHGYKVDDILKALKEGGIDGFEKFLSTNPKGVKDHQAKKDKDMSHEGYQKYQSVRKQLSDRDDKYKKAFDNDNN